MPPTSEKANLLIISLVWLGLLGCFWWFTFLVYRRRGRSVCAPRLNGKWALVSILYGENAPKEDGLTVGAVREVKLPFAGLI